jgi:CHAD domain-containing protein
MKKRKLRQYFSKEYNEGQDALRTFIKKNDEEALHHFRVQVKKLQAFVFIEHDIEGPGGLKKHFKPLRRIFKKAGVMRDAQLQVVLGIEQHAGKGFVGKQRKEMKDNAHDFRSHGRIYLRRASKSKQRMGKDIKSLTAENIQTFYEEKLHWIAGHINNEIEDLHACRKQIKILIYNYKFSCKALKQPINKDYLKELEKAIGDWHDINLALEIYPALQEKEQVLLKRVHSLTTDFYKRAVSTTV